MSAKKKTLAFNAILNILNTCITMAFSLITYPYVSRILQVTNWGKINYSNSIVSYFALFASLGFNTYSIREGSKRRESSERINEFASQIFSLNFFTVILSYVILTISLICVKQFRGYEVLILLQSIVMISNWIGINWVLVVFEDYLYITIRVAIVQILSLVCLLLWVKTPEDYIQYVIIISLSNICVGLINLLYSKKYCKIRLTLNVQLREHVKPVAIFFSNTLAVTIYLNSDITMIGWIMGDYYVGLYSVAVKIYTAIKTIIAAVYNTAIAKMSSCINENKREEFYGLLYSIANMIVLIAVPLTAILYSGSGFFITLLSGKTYLEAETTLKILSFSFLFAIMGGTMAYCVLIPMGYEKIVLFATLLSAIENILLNCFLIPEYGINGAAITTLIAEITVFAILIFRSKKIIELKKMQGVAKNVIKSVVASIPIYVAPLYMEKITYHARLWGIIIWGVALGGYFVVQALLCNDFFIKIISEIGVKIYKQKK